MSVYYHGSVMVLWFYYAYTPGNASIDEDMGRFSTCLETAHRPSPVTARLAPARLHDVQ